MTEAQIPEAQIPEAQIPERQIPEAAAAGFGAGSDAYERARPSYPADAVAWIVDRIGAAPGAVVLDLAAGTGKFTRLLEPTGAAVVAVEPVAAMRAHLEASSPRVRVLDGTAEAIPLPDASVDAVTVAQAFHWFRHGEALAEIARVLRPGGKLALVWNRRDESVPWVARMSDVLGWRAHAISSYDRTDWPAVIAAAGTFAAVDHATFPWAHEVDRQALADRVRSISYVAAMDEVGREALVGDVLALVEGFPERFALPYTTLAWTCRRR